jgi:hypothetical protein
MDTHQLSYFSGNVREKHSFCKTQKSCAFFDCDLVESIFGHWLRYISSLICTELSVAFLISTPLTLFIKLYCAEGAWRESRTIGACGDSMAERQRRAGEPKASLLDSDAEPPEHCHSIKHVRE